MIEKQVFYAKPFRQFASVLYSGMMFLVWVKNIAL